MSSSKLKKLISESYNNRLNRLNENIITDIMALILTPKLKKAMKSLKADPEFKELEQQIKKSKEELEAIAKRLERNLEKRQETINDMQKAGIKVNDNMSPEQMFRSYKEWQAKLNKSVGLKSSGLKDWQKYFK